ncbi:MAG: rhodanese family protein [Burkholderiaceae bacterium]|nr:rhodanese family protein [Burkholderiaceae bacterium]
MPLKSLTPQAARDLMDKGAVLIDIRAANEHAREHIKQARHIPLEQLTGQTLAMTDGSAVIFHCRSGNRTLIQAQALAASAPGDAYVLAGGLDAWKKAGLPVVADRSQPLELQRQVQITAGAIIVLGAVLGATVSPWFHALSGFVGVGLMFAGLSGYCGMARLLIKMPWNRRAVQG